MTHEQTSSDVGDTLQAVLDLNRTTAQNAQQFILTRQVYEPAAEPDINGDTVTNIYQSTTYLGRLARFTRIFTMNVGYMDNDVLKTHDMMMDDTVMAAVETARDHVYDGLQKQPTDIDHKPETLSALLAQYNTKLVSYPIKLHKVYFDLVRGDIRHDEAIQAINKLERHVGRVVVLPVIVSSAALFEAVLHSNYAPAITLPTLQYYATNIKNAELTS